MYEATLLYSDTFYNPEGHTIEPLLTSGDNKPSALYAALYPRLHEAFFEHLYVERPEQATLVRQLGADVGHIIKGYAGCGKSTLVRKLAADHPARPNFSITILDLNVHTHEYEPADRCKEGLCASLYAALRATLRDVLVDFQKQFLIHRLLVGSTPDHELLRESFTEQYLLDEDNIEQALLNDSIYKTRERTLYDSLSHAARLTLSLEYLCARKHRAVIIFDNVDRFDSTVHNIVFDLAQDLGRGTPFPLAHTIVCVRNDNLQRMKPDRYSHISKTFELTKLATNRKTLFQYVQKRIEFANTFIKKWVRTDAGRKYIGTSTINEASLVYFEAFLRALEKANLFECFVDWHNESLRWTALTIMRFYDASNTQTNFLGKASVERAMGEALAGAPRDLHTFAFRHLLLNRELADFSLPDLFSHDIRPVRRWPVHFLPLKLLLYLRRSEERRGKLEDWHSEGVTAAELLTEFSCLEIDERTVLEALLALAKPRGRQPYGYVHVDIHMNTWHAAEVHPALQSKEVHLLPAGRHLLDWLGRNCEYLFWNALDSDLTFRPWPGGGKGSLIEKISDDSFRAATALNYFYKHVVLPNTLEVEAIARASDDGHKCNDMTLKTRYIEILGISATRPFYFETVKEKILVFVANERCPRTYEDELNHVADRINQEVTRWRNLLFPGNGTQTL